MRAEYLVTGGGGFIGSNLVHALVSAGRAVRVLDDFSTGRRQNLRGVEQDVEILVGDIRNDRLLRKAVRGVSYVLHVAALPSVARSVEDPLSTNSVNVCGTLKVLLAAREAGARRVVFSSSSSVYGDVRVLPKREDLAPAPRSPYALSKLAGEHYARMFTALYGLETFSLRYFNVFGPRQDPHSEYAAVVPRFIAALSRGRPPVIYGDGRQTRDFTFVDDVVAANLRCCRARAAAAGGVFNIGGGNRVSINDLAAELGALVGRKVRPVHAAPRAGDVRDSQADLRKARKDLGWSPRVSFEEGLARTVEWFLSRGK